MTRALKDRIRSVLGFDSARWYNGLAADLTAWCWSDLASLGLNPENYSSSRVIKLDLATPRHGHLSNNSGWNRPLLIEFFDEAMKARYGPIGLRPPAAPFDLPEFEKNLADAMALLKLVGPVGSSVEELVWSLTPVDVDSPEYDTSYSDPAIPLSIFIGAHLSIHHVSPLRLAEGVLHEAMHLQLSLIEDVVPLVRGCSDWHHSPWQRRLRPTQGLLHGLYVFRVIQDFFREAIASGTLHTLDLFHAQKRVSQIDNECAELVSMRDSVDLTADGARLREALLG